MTTITRRRKGAAIDVGPDPERTTLRFTDGLVVDVVNCPRAIPARRHWNADGTCCCPPGTPTRKWVRP